VIVDVSLRPSARCDRLPNFWVLLGPDFSGKSSVLAKLSRRSDASLISYDQEILGEKYALIGRLREAFVTDALPGLGSLYSPDFVLSLFNAYMIFLRDRVVESAGDKPIVVDSYYYKIIAKCFLSGFRGSYIFDLWRSFPQPSSVIYLDIDMDVAWRRSAEGRNLNTMEYYGEAPSRDGFVRYQRDLCELMMAEVPGADIHKVVPSDSVAETSEQIEQIIFSPAPTLAARLPVRAGDTIFTDRNHSE
jgi:thymidylate kinase